MSSGPRGPQPPEAHRRRPSGGLLLICQRYFVEEFLTRDDFELRPSFRQMFHDIGANDVAGESRQRGALRSSERGPRPRKAARAFVPGLGAFGRPIRLPIDHVDYRNGYGDSIRGRYRRRTDVRTFPASASPAFVDETPRVDLDARSRAEMREFWTRTLDRSSVPGPQWHEYVPCVLTTRRKLSIIADHLVVVPGGQLASIIDQRDGADREFRRVRLTSALSWFASDGAQEIQAEAATSEPEPALYGFAPRLHVFLYGFGLIQVVVSLRFVDRLSWAVGLDEVLGAISGDCVRHRRASFAIDNLELGDISELGGAVADKVASSAFLETTSARARYLGRSSLLAFEDHRTADGVDWLMSGSTGERLGPSLPPRDLSEVKVMGFRREDVIGATRTRTVVSTPQLRKDTGRLAWNLLHIRELAEAQKALLPRLEQRASMGDRVELERVAQVLSSLTTFHLGLHSHHRKWLYKCQESLGAPQVLDQARDIAMKLGTELRSTTPASGVGVPSIAKLRISVDDNAVVGAINFGQIVGDIENNLNHPGKGSNQDSLRAALAELAEAVLASGVLQPSEKEVLLQRVSDMADLRRRDLRWKVDEHDQAFGDIADLTLAWSSVSRQLRAYLDRHEPT